MSTPPSFIGLPARLVVEGEQWRQHLWQALCELRVWSPGTVQSVDWESLPQPTVTVQLGVQENINVNLVPTPTALPLITVPFCVIRSGGFLLTMPVKQGDECIVLFGDNDWHGWWQSGGVQNQPHRRRHDIRDGVAIFGLSSWARPISNYSQTTAQLRTEDGDAYVEVTGGHVVNIVAPSGCNINGVQIDSSGNVTTPGTVTASGEGTFNSGHTVSQHEHAGVQTGSGVTETPTG
jgi:hypothetical protein